MSDNPIKDMYYEATNNACDLMMKASAAIKAGDVETWNRLSKEAVDVQQKALDAYNAAMATPAGDCTKICPIHRKPCYRSANHGGMCYCEDCPAGVD